VECPAAAAAVTQLKTCLTAAKAQSVVSAATGTGKTCMDAVRTQFKAAKANLDLNAVKACGKAMRDNSDMQKCFETMRSQNNKSQ